MPKTRLKTIKHKCITSVCAFIYLNFEFKNKKKSFFLNLTAFNIKELIKIIFYCPQSDCKLIYLEFGIDSQNLGLNMQVINTMSVMFSMGPCTGH